MRLGIGNQVVFDRLLGCDESLHDKWLYLLENPVRAGLVKDWKDWPYRFEFNKGRQLQDAARLPASVASHRFGKRSACPTTHDSPLLQWQPERLPQQIIRLDPRTPRLLD